MIVIMMYLFFCFIFFFILSIAVVFVVFVINDVIDEDDDGGGGGGCGGKLIDIISNQFLEPTNTEQLVQSFFALVPLTGFEPMILLSVLELMIYT